MQSVFFYIKHFDILKRGLLTFFSPILTDTQYIRAQWKLKMPYRLDLKNPKSYNEKLQWLKIHDRNPLYTIMVDKVLVKDYVSKIVGPEYVIPLIKVWDRVEDIDWDSLPQQFVIKCSHDSGGLVVCRDKSKLNIKDACKKLNKSLRSQYYWKSREWPYKNVKPRIFAERYLEDEYGELRDYKFFCFDGEVKALFIATERMKDGEETKFDFFDENYNHLPFTNGHPNADVLPQKPACFDEMKILAAKLSKGIPHVRVDFYEVNGSVFFGELTFFHWSGFTPFVPAEWDYIFGSWIKLPENI